MIMASFLDYLREGPRILFSSWKQRMFPRKYSGSAQQICQQIVEECWNGRYFQTSTGNFRQFWTRDFGWCTQSLLKLGYEKEVQQTLRYALHRFKKANQITTTLTPGGKPYDFPNYAVDSLPWLIHSLRISKFPYYDHKDFLNKEIQKFFEKVINTQTGLVKPEESFSSIKDFAVRKSSCYDNCLVALLAKDLKSMKGLINLFKDFDYPSLIKRHFWQGNYFYDDLSHQKYVAGDANLFPFLLGIIKNEEMLTLALHQIQKAGLDQPFPLKHTASREGIKFIPQEILFRNYESHSLWTHMGLLFVRLTEQIDKEKAKEYKQKYTEWIEKHGNYLEVFTLAGQPFRTPFYHCDSGMLWAANYLML